MDASSEDETREGLIGMTLEGRLLFVVHVEQGGEIFRVVSARPAIAAERRFYEDG